MKKIVALLMALCMVFALAACGQSAAPAATEAPAADAAADAAPAAEEKVVIKFGYTPGDLKPEESREVCYATTFKEYVESHSDSITVEKKWSDGNDKHMRESVTVQLYRNGEPYSLTMFGRVVDDGRVELSAANRWQHTWNGLDTGYKWTVAELNVPKGYVSTVNYYGGSAIITNTAASAGLPQTGDAQMPYIGAGLVLAAMAIVVIIAGKKRN